MDRLEGKALSRSPPGSGPSANDSAGPPSDEVTMARLERMSSAQGRRQLSIAGRQATQSVRDGIEEMRRRPSMRERADRAAAALDGKPLERAASACAARPPAPPLKRTLTAPRSRSMRLRPQEDVQALSRTLSATIVDDDAAAEKQQPETLLFSWGRGSLLHDAATAPDASTPVAKFASRGVRIVNCATSGYHALCADSEGRVFAAGANEGNQGDASRPEDALPRAVRVECLPIGARIVAIACGARHSVCITSQGRVLCWGANDRGQCGDRRDTVQPRAVQGVLARCVAATVCCGDAFTTCVTSRFEVYAWGAQEACGSPEAKADDRGAVEVHRINTLVGVPVIGLAAGAGHCVAHTQTGEAWSWGRDEHGQCGVGDATLGRATLVEAPKRLEVPSSIDRVACGRAHTLLLTKSGAVLGCGRNHAGQLGLAERKDVLLPTAVFPSLLARAVIAVAGGDAHSLAVLDDGSLLAFGRPVGCGATGSEVVDAFPVPLPLERPCFHVVAAGDASLALCRGSPGAPVRRASAAPGAPFWRDGYTDFAVQGAKLAKRADSFLQAAASAAPICSAEAAAVGAQAAGGDAGALDRVCDVLAWPSLLSASFVRDAPAAPHDDCRFDEDAFEACFAPLDAFFRADDAARRRAALAILAGATRLGAARHEANSADAARCAVSLLAATAAVLSGDHPTGENNPSDEEKVKGATSLLAWEAARAAIEVVLSAHEATRARAVVACLPTDREDREVLRERLRRPLRFLVATACRRAGLDGVLPCGGQFPALGQLSSLKVEGELSMARDVILDRPAALARAASALQRVGALPPARTAFSAARHALFGLELLRRAGAASNVPREETLERYRVPEVDSLGVVIAMPSEDASPYQPGPGGLLIDFLKWQEASAPSVNTDSCWYLSGHAWLASPAARRELLSFDARRRQQQSFLQTAMRAQLSGEGVPYLVLEVPRQSLLEDSLAFLRSVPGADLTKELKIKFKGEQGVDAGGLKKEFFQLLVPQLFDPVVGMFSRTAHEEVFFNAACDWYLDEYELAGLLVGLAVYNSVVLEVRLPVVAYKKLLYAGARTPEFEPTLSDLGQLDASLAKGLRSLLTFEPGGDVEGVFCRTFEDDDPNSAPGAGDMVELLPDGAQTPVTGENREDYVAALCDYRLKTAVATQFDRFAKGFWRVLGQSSIERVVEAEELRVMVQGDEAPLDWEALQGVCAYEGFGASAGEDSGEAAPTGDADASPGDDNATADGELAGDAGSGESAPPGGDDEAPGGTGASPLRRKSSHGHSHSNVPVIKALWAAVASFDEALQRDFLMFVTGSKTAPMGGLGALRPPAHSSFKIQRAGPDSNALPTSHTCFNTLLLPEYDPPSKLRRHLEYAVREGHEGFALE